MRRHNEVLKLLAECLRTLTWRDSAASYSTRMKSSVHQISALTLLLRPAYYYLNVIEAISDSLGSTETLPPTEYQGLEFGFQPHSTHAKEHQ